MNATSSKNSISTSVNVKKKKNLNCLVHNSLAFTN